MADYHKLNNTSDFVREIGSKGIVATNQEARLAARAKSNQSYELASLKLQLSILQKDVEELKRVVYGSANSHD